MQKVNLSTLARHIWRLRIGNEFTKKQSAEIINKECKNLPSGSGIDSGVRFLIDESTPEKMVFSVPYHHMSEVGHYDGWTTYKLTVKPSFWRGFDLKITGRDKNGTKDYLYELFSDTFTIDSN